MAVRQEERLSMGATEPRRVSTASADGTALRLLEFGEPAATPPVLFVHGAFGHAHVWDFVVRELPAGMHCLAIDLRGHGESGWAPAPRGYAFERLAEDIAAAVAVAGRPPLLVAHSMAAAVGMQFAGTRPGAVVGCVFIDIDPLAPPHQITHLNEVGANSPKRYPAFERVLARQERSTAKATPEVHRHLAEHSFEQRDGEWVERFDPAFLRTLRQWDVRPYLPDITVPVLVLRAGIQSVMSDAGYDELLAAIPHARGEIIADGTHQMHLDAPAATAAAILRFLGEIAG
ncbi:MAG: alpha/beta hydrolase [Dehalococcoidia bacterium]